MLATITPYKSSKSKYISYIRLHSQLGQMPSAPPSFLQQRRLRHWTMKHHGSHKQESPASLCGLLFGAFQNSKAMAEIRLVSLLWIWVLRGKNMGSLKGEGEVVSELLAEEGGSCGGWEGAVVSTRHRLRKNLSKLSHKGAPQRPGAREPFHWRGSQIKP